MSAITSHSRARSYPRRIASNSDPETRKARTTNDGLMHILVAVTVPAGTADGTGDVTTVTGVSVFDPTKTDTATDTIKLGAGDASAATGHVRCLSASCVRLRMLYSPTAHGPSA